MGIAVLEPAEQPATVRDTVPDPIIRFPGSTRLAPKVEYLGRAPYSGYGTIPEWREPKGEEDD